MIIKTTVMLNHTADSCIFKCDLRVSVQSADSKVNACGQSDVFEGDNVA